MPTDTQVSGILFADVVNSSAGKQDQQIVEVQRYLQEFVDKQVAADTCLFKNTWGDGVILACADPNDALEHSLKLRAWFKNRNWGRAGFPAPLQVRVGLHAERIHLEKKGDIVSGVAGRHIVLTARIEPIVPPGRIYCTETFYLLVKDEAEGFIRFNDLGSRQLAKSFASSRLFEVLEGNEVVAEPARTQEQAFGATIPKIRKEFTDAEKESFLEDGFKNLCDYFERASKMLQESDKDLEVRTRKISETKLTVEAFVKGTSRAKCQIWLSKDMFGKGIRYSQSFQQSDNSFNESLSVTSDGYSLVFTASGMLGYGNSKPLSTREGAELYWQGFIKQLQ
jgi:class 3 adenylate cyclase